MFFKKDRLDQLSTSELVYHFTFSDNSSFDVDKVSDKLLKRLNRTYKLDEEASKKFIIIEQNKFLDRGDNLTDYLFNGQKSVEDSLKTFYRYESKIYPTMSVKERFNDLTFSELARLYSLFQEFKLNFQQREIKLLLAEKKEYNEDKSKELLDRAKEEHKMASYYDLLKKCMISKMIEMLQYKKLSEKQKFILLAKELKYANDQKTGYEDFFKNYNDLSFDAFSNDKQITESFGTEAYVFKKK